MLLSAAAVAACTPQRAVARAGDAIHVRSVGEGEAVWVLLHPFSASGHFWEARATALAAEHGVRILSPDLPSHGRSRIVERFTYDIAADAVGAALAAHAERIALFVGASSGGLTALKLAARLGKPVAAIGVGAAFSAANIALMQTVSRAPVSETTQFEQGAAQRAAIQRHNGDLAALGEAPLLTGAECHALARRALIINGAMDDFFLRDSAHALADAIPGSVLSFVTGAGHLEPLAPAYRDYTWASIATFLRTRA
jgi:pimeloyl-ACP methyl ester carboxylesterase